MTRANPRHRWRAAGIRTRLGLALGLALLPVLILSGLQSALIFQRDAADRRAEYAAAVLRDAASARARIIQSQELLREVSAGSTDYQCVTRLANIKSRLSGYVNIIRFNAEGWVTCSAAPVPLASNRLADPWFQILAKGRQASVATDQQVEYAQGPAVLANVRVERNDGGFVGVMTSVMTLTSLLPENSRLFVPHGAEVGLADASGPFVSAAVESVFPRDLRGRLSDAGRADAVIWVSADLGGESRLFAAAPVYGRDVYLVLSGPSEGLLSWVRLHPISAFLLPILAFALALAAVWWVAEQGVVRWVVYLRRIAAMYAGGRYGVRPLRATAAPAEIRDLADTIGAMAATIGARDAALKETLAAKDDMMREIHHRVKNNLQVISSLLNIQQRTLVNEAAVAAINDTRQRIVALGLIYRALYEGPDLKHVDFCAFVNELIAHVLVDKHGRSYPIRTILVIDPLTIDPDRLAPLALFIVEAVTSIVGHGFIDDDGSLAIDFGVRGNEASLVIRIHGSCSGLNDGALSMMGIFARQLGGAVTHTTSPADGASVRLTFPMQIAIFGDAA